MEFRTCSINGIKYVEENYTLMRAMDNSAIHLQRVEEFTVILANMCNIFTLYLIVLIV